MEGVDQPVSALAKVRLFSITLPPTSSTVPRLVSTTLAPLPSMVRSPTPAGTVKGAYAPEPTRMV